MEMLPNKGLVNDVSFIHVGLQKTGTKWLQEGLFSFHPQLEVIGSLSKQKRSSRSLIENLYSKKYAEDLWVKEYNRLIHPERPRILGISNEQLSGHLWSMDQGLELVSRLKRIFGDVKIILVLRNPITFIQSGYIQSIKSGTETKALQCLLQDEKSRNRIINRIRYQQLIDSYKSNFSDVLVLPYELLRNSQEDFLHRICTFLNIEDFDLSLVRNIRKNEGVSLLAQQILKNANRLDKVFFPKKRYINRVIRKSIQFLPENLPRMKPINREFLLTYPGFEYLTAPNYKMWNKDLAMYNYFQEYES